VSEVIEIISNEIANLSFTIAFNIAITIAFAWFISKFAKNTIPRLLWIVFALYLISSPKVDPNKVLYDIDILFGIGFILPHIKFFFNWIDETYNDLKRATVDSYVFMITVFYKIRNFFLWFYYTYKKIKAFFTKENYNEHSHKQDYHQKSNRQQENNYYKQEQQNHNNYEDFRNQDQAKSEQRRQERQQNQSYSSNESYSGNSSYTNNKSAEQILEETLSNDPNFKHFFSDDEYEVLGVNRDDDLKTVKKKYRKVAFENHPDRNNEEKDKYEIIFKRINGANEKIMRKFK
jgi:DnaJ-domain-containing protein 1